MSSLLTSIPDEKVVKVGVRVGVLGLQGEHGGVGWGVQLYHSLKKIKLFFRITSDQYFQAREIAKVRADFRP
jgi:hypothetical protein